MCSFRYDPSMTSFTKVCIFRIDKLAGLAARDIGAMKYLYPEAPSILMEEVQFQSLEVIFLLFPTHFSL